MNVKKVRVNEEITISPVRMIDEDGKQIGIVSIEQARDAANGAGLDLVEVAPNSSPPVCRIMDYGKYRYENSKKTKQTRKKRHIFHIKEIKMRSEISDHDFNFKIRHAIEFLKRGDKVKFTLIFRGREILHKEIGEEVLKRIADTLEDIAVIESPVRSEGKNLTMIMTTKN